MAFEGFTGVRDQSGRELRPDELERLMDEHPELFGGKRPAGVRAGGAKGRKRVGAATSTEPHAKTREQRVAEAQARLDAQDAEERARSAETTKRQEQETSVFGRPLTPDTRDKISGAGIFRKPQEQRRMMHEAPEEFGGELDRITQALGLQTPPIGRRPGEQIYKGTMGGTMAFSNVPGAGFEGAEPYTPPGGYATGMPDEQRKQLLKKLDETRAALAAAPKSEDVVTKEAVSKLPDYETHLKREGWEATAKKLSMDLLSGKLSGAAHNRIGAALQPTRREVKAGTEAQQFAAEIQNYRSMAAGDEAAPGIGGAAARDHLLQRMQAGQVDDKVGRQTLKYLETHMKSYDSVPDNARKTFLDKWIPADPDSAQRAHQKRFGPSTVQVPDAGPSLRDDAQAATEAAQGDLQSAATGNAGQPAPKAYDYATKRERPDEEDPMKPFASLGLATLPMMMNE